MNRSIIDVIKHLFGAHGSIARRIAMTLLSLGILATIISAMVQTYYDYQNELKINASKVDGITVSHGPSLSESIWNYSEKRIEIELRGILDIPGIEFAEATSVKGDVWAAGIKSFPDVFTTKIPLTVMKNGKDEHLGTLSLQIKQQGLYDHVKSNLIGALVSFGVWAIFLAISLFIVFNQFVTRHLHALAEYTDGLSLDADSPPLVLDRPKSKLGIEDEFDKVVYAINSAHSRLTLSSLELRESEDRFHAFGDAASDWFWEMDENLLFTFGSERFFEITGLKPDDVYGHGRRDFINPELEEIESAKWRGHFELLEHRQPFKYLEYKTTTKDNRIIHISLSGSPAFNLVGDFVGYRGTGADITERKQLEEQLTQAQRMEAVGQLTGGVAHDFNNLLHVMIGNAEMLKLKSGEDKRSQEYVDTIIEAVDRASSLTNRLLAFSRQQTLSPVAANVTDNIDNLADMLQRTLGETIDLKSIQTPDLWLATIDAHQFENALVNLALNARDAMPIGGTLTIETANVTLDETYAKQHEEVTPGDYVKVAVSDTGTGMSPEVLEKVFEPFFTTKDVGQGSGLGLSMVFGFAKQSNGHLTIYSEEGHGTTVKLYMPRSEEDIAHDGTKEKAQEFAPGTERILVVEDDENVREISVNILSEQGYKVIMAVDGKEAIRHINDGQHIDLLFTDMVLPGGMNGVEIAEQAKQLQPNIKVLYTTGYAENSVIHNGKLDPGVTLVNKPYRRAELLEKVRQILDEKGD